MKISVIFAISENNVLGVNNEIPWNLEYDLYFFKALTVQKPVIMGRKTWESLVAKRGNNPLPNRIIAIVSPTLKNKRPSTPNLPNPFIFESLQEALSFFGKVNQEVFIIGGKYFIEEGMKIADAVYLTIIDTLVEEKENTVTVDIGLEKEKQNGFFTVKDPSEKLSIEKITNLEEISKDKRTKYSIIKLVRNFIIESKHLHF